MELRKYQTDVIDEVKALIAQGKRRISVIMPTGTGITTVACIIGNEILKNTIVLANMHVLCESYKQRQDELYSQSQVLVATTNNFSMKKEETFSERIELTDKSYILFNTTPFERQRLKEILPSNSIIVSFGNVPVIAADTESIVSCVFYADDLFDVRDAIAASTSDSDLLKNQIKEKKSQTEKLIQIRKMTPYGASSGATNEELEVLKKALEKRDLEIAEQETKIKIYESILSSIGIPLDMLNENVRLITAQKKLLSQRIDNGDELAVEELTRYIAQKSLDLFSTYVTGFSKEHFESMIKACLTEEIWEKMCDNSRSCIITSKVAYDSIQKNDTDDTMDYSGVCILASKALDIEISKRFIVEYISYLRSTLDISAWPKVLFDKNGCLLTEDAFTLGTAQFVLGIDKDGNIKNRYSYNMFQRYAKAKLYSTSLSNEAMKIHLTRCIECIEKVRTDFRNPSAHRTSIDRITAKECIDYLVDTYKKLKEILIYMN